MTFNQIHDTVVAQMVALGYLSSEITSVISITNRHDLFAFVEGHSDLDWPEE